MLTLVNGKHMFRHRHRHRHRYQHQDQCQHQHRHQLTDIASGTGIVTSPRGLCSWSGFVYTTCRKLNTVTDHRQTHKQRTQTTKSAERHHKERAGKAKRAFTPHPHTLFIHTHSLTITQFVLCIAFALFHTVFHHTSCHALRRLSTHTSGVFGLHKPLHTFGAVLLCCLLRGTVVITYEV